MINNNKRGLNVLLSDELSIESSNTPDNEVKPNSAGNEVLSSTEAIHQVATILESVPERQFKNIMNAVIAIRRTAHGETVEELGESLREIRKRDSRGEDNQKPRRGFWRWK